MRAKCRACGHTFEAEPGPRQPVGELGESPECPRCGQRRGIRYDPEFDRIIRETEPLTDERREAIRQWREARDS